MQVSPETGLRIHIDRDEAADERLRDYQ